MSRSFRHTPIIGNAGTSDKDCKRTANRCARHSVRHLLRSTLTTGDDFDALVLPLLREVSNVYDFSKDGRHYMNLAAKPHLAEYMRK
ncbi:MAG: hypothetical protein K2W95_14615 [Candidatus Obscuribacterales bacterium]|nr:hypothetical protein [Candidatus Obscuribacterales bacterium]